MKKPGLIFALSILLIPAGVSLYAEGLDDLIAGPDKDLSTALLLDAAEPVSQKEFETRMAAALKQKDAAIRRKQLSELIGILVQTEDIVLLPRDWRAFAEAALTTVDPATLSANAIKLLKAPENIQFDLSAQSRLNLGIRFSLAGGGVPFETLKGIYDRCKHADWIDMEWLLPSLARAGGAPALPLVTPYRSDASIIPLGNEQNIRRVPCAAVLACAYAGDTNAMGKVLAWYEADTLNRPRFAFYVAWGISEGMKPDYVLLDYCQHRIAQAERFLDFLGKERIPDLIVRANREASISLTTYLTRKMEAAPPAELPLFLSFAEHPDLLVKQRALLLFLDRGDAALRETANARLRALLKSPRGTDRFVAAETLAFTDRANRAALLDEAIARETNPSVRLRLDALRTGSAW